MTRLKLYQVAHDDTGALTFVTATDNDHAAQIYVVNEVAAGRHAPSFAVERVDITLAQEQRLGLDEMLAHGVSGVATSDPLFGWCVSVPA